VDVHSYHSKRPREEMSTGSSLMSPGAPMRKDLTHVVQHWQVLMLEKVNRGSGDSFGNLEAQWRGLIGGKTPSSVEVTVRPQYDGDSAVPTLFEVDFRVNNGRWQDAEFGNTR
jgi:hypothetical protein